MFIDEAQITVRSGKGGDGMVHFRREKYVPRGGPDGGDGGRGGNVIMEVSITLNTLSHFHYKKKYIAEDGKNGGTSKKTGRSAEALIVNVPPGTILYDSVSGEILGDLTSAGQQLVIATGGRGGRGNARFANSRDQAPRIAERGEPGQERLLKLELKLIADVGIVGVPNAGKSSLLAAITRATPKIGDYPFTTIEPNLGVVEMDLDNSFVVADIPGLLEGAHAGVGLGDSFLRHIQRTRIIIHLLDGLSQDPIADFSQTNNEMALFDPDLQEKYQIVAVNKIDLPEVQQKWPDIKEKLAKLGHSAFAISAFSRDNLDVLLKKTMEQLEKIPPVEQVSEMPVYRTKKDIRDYQIEKTEDGWRVSGERIERSAAMTYWEHDGSIRRFQRLIGTIGLEDALRKAGIKSGDTVHIGPYELEWQD